MDRHAPSAAVITVGSELTDGLGLDTNSQEIAQALSRAGYRVDELVSLPDERGTLAETIRRLTASRALVIITGGLGPTHDDVTREAAADALGLSLLEDPDLRRALEGIATRHRDPQAALQVFAQALVLDGATVLPPTNGTAPGQIIPTPAGRLVLLPGPPHEMRGMLAAVLPDHRVSSRILGCVGLTESDAQVIAQRALEGVDGVRLTVLASPGNVRIVLVPEGADASVLDNVVAAVAVQLGPRCYTTTGRTLVESVHDLAAAHDITIATAESCTGGLVSAALTDVPGSSATFAGGTVTYSDESKTRLLGVDPALLARFGAVSGEVSSAMAMGARRRVGADIAVSVTGIAGPDGGTAEKPVGLVWFGVSDEHGTVAVRRNLFGDRAGVRERATVVALDLLRRRIAGLKVE